MRLAVKEVRKRPAAEARAVEARVAVRGKHVVHNARTRAGGARPVVHRLGRKARLARILGGAHVLAELEYFSGVDASVEVIGGVHVVARALRIEPVVKQVDSRATRRRSLHGAIFDSRPRLRGCGNAGNKRAEEKDGDAGRQRAAPQRSDHGAPLMLGRAADARRSQTARATDTAAETYRVRGTREHVGAYLWKG